MRFRKRTKWVGLRISWDLYEELLAEGEEKGITLTEIIRSTLEERQLRGAKLEETRQIVRELRPAISELGRDIAELMAAILVTFGNQQPENARDWVLSNFGQRG